MVVCEFYKGWFYNFWIALIESRFDIKWFYNFGSNESKWVLQGMILQPESNGMSRFYKEWFNMHEVKMSAFYRVSISFVNT